MKVLILCGGKGIRAFPFTEYMPKPMLPVGGSPILLQVMRNYVAQGVDEFILAAGHHRHVIEDYFEGKNVKAKVQIVDTGDDADTGDRIYHCRDLLGDVFFATYADGLSDVPIDKLLAFHKGHKGLVTITSVPLISQYGTIESNGDGQIVEFKEKPVMREHWINTGYFVFDHAVFDQWNGNNLEREVLPALAAKQLAFTYKHDGFFKSMDTYKDQQEFEELLRNGRIPWLVKGKLT